ncbi:haloacid dehalogenase-like hydrolase domain-containing protein At2g33255 [Macadamia integrifolia]|uniref:haloacid dehalogenase-like hydrolase domain-containing protein At2g33255 n=1 Tax=Macadamia integrifolia TaxID=60698 RepID=UPI001C4E64FE|nr:haloacid dehalogenase-like hydrolase domain-containing protein At2g33255 [Macadamia integrifolia]XP_042515957.1 haloacid dehalogenase-like hydrolase domain-containing protein At2g33255 [Macadamia integrifolia]XP_042515958.1 haloacid dehalogenase-like hydrolase domain-containing protein At2g33255 [Macadamia integrifolia]
MPLLLSRAFCFFHSRSRSSMAHLSTSSTIVKQKVRRLKGVVFDMDGTLTVPVIDFPAMYKSVLGEQEYASIRAQNPSGIDILHHIESWSPDKQQKAYDIIADFERQGLERLQIMPGAAELCGFLDSKKIRRGLITRNVKAAVDLFHQRFGMTFSPALSREFRPYKPDPAPLLYMCGTWDVHPTEVIMVGDCLQDDVACGKRAGAHTCLLDETGRYNSPEFDSVDFKPDFKVSSLTEVCSLLEENFDLIPES